MSEKTQTTTIGDGKAQTSTVDMDDFYVIAMDIEAVKSMLEILLEDFFEGFDPEKDNPGGALCGFLYTRSLAHVVERILECTQEDFENLGITVDKKILQEGNGESGTSDNRMKNLYYIALDIKELQRVFREIVLDRFYFAIDPEEEEAAAKILQSFEKTKHMVRAVQLVIYCDLEWLKGQGL